MRLNHLQTVAVAVVVFCIYPAILRAEDAASNSSAAYKVGDTGPAGGIIFYDKGNESGGWRYLECAPRDQGNDVPWSNGNYQNIPLCQIGDIGSGKTNTSAIVAAQGAGEYAASLCANLDLGGYKDWFLPSHDELQRVYTTLKLKGHGNLTAKGYWTSSQYRDYEAWYQNFNNGNQFGYDSAKGLSVRAIRAF